MHRATAALARAGAIVTLVALALLGATVAGALLGAGPPTVTVTYDR